MSGHNFSSVFSLTLHRLFHRAPNRRTRRALRRLRTTSRLTLEYLESRVLLSSYIFEDLGTLSGTSSTATAINAKGEVVGSVRFADGTTHAVLWDPGKPAQDLGTLGGSNSSAEAINIVSEIVGKADSASAKDQPFFLQPGGKMTNVNDALPTSAKNADDSLLSAHGVNDTGVIVGQALFNVIDGFETSSYSLDPASGAFNQLDASGSPTAAVAVAGTKAVAANKFGAAVEDINTPNSSVTLPGIGNTADSIARGISTPNSSGAQFATGELDTDTGFHAVLWTIPQDPHSATASDLGNNSSGFAVNSSGDVVGDEVVSGAPVAFVKYHDGSSITSLNSLIPADAGIALQVATGINDSGQICGFGVAKDGQEHAFRLTPVVTVPQATLTDAEDINVSGATTYSFTVTYTDDSGIDPNTLANAIQVTGPKSFSQTASFVKTSGPSTQLAATYSITAPGGKWDFSDNGTYTITLNDKVVKNTSGQPLAGGTLGHFIAAIDVKRVSISGTVFNDFNGSGKQESGEAGVPNTDVFLDLNEDGTFDGGDLITRTDANGAYSFNGLLPGNYSIKELVIPPHGVTSPLNDVLLVAVTEGQNLTGQNFGDVIDPQISGIAGQSLFNAQGKTAQFDQPPTVLHITGTNFDANDNFFFGNDKAVAPMTNLQTDSNGIQTFDVQVPAFATTGEIVVFSPRTKLFTTILNTFTVDSYRNVNGYSFNNDGKTPDGSAPEPDFTFDEMTTVFGEDQTHISVDPCGDLTFGLENCTIDTCVPNPLVYLELAIINSVLAPTNGECLGFSLSAARFSLGLVPSYNIDGQSEQIEGYPTTNTDPDTTSTVWQLTNSNSLRELIRLAQLEQTSVEVLSHYVNQVRDDEVLGVSHLISDVKSELAQGRPVPIGLLLPAGGHCVLAYNVEDHPGGTEVLDVYDPDLPFDASTEETTNTPSSFVPGVEDGTTHADRAFRSSITFDANGNWTYNGGAGSGSGGLGSIAPIPMSQFDSHTIVAGNITSLLLDAVFGSAAETQVTDSSGHTLLNADGSPNTDSKTNIPNAARFDLDKGATPLDLIQGTGSFMQTITGTGSGTYGATSLSSDAMAAISGVASVKGQTDQFGLDPSNDKLTFIPASNKSLTADLVINTPAGVQREAQLTSTAGGGATQTLQFQGDQRDHVVFNPGAAGTFSLNLTSNANGKVQTFTTGRMSLAAGDSVDVLPSDWADIQTATATVVVHHANGTTTTSTISNGGAGLQVSAKEDVAFTGTVARFTNQTAAGKSAVIDWGDGTTSNGTVAASGSDVTVSGSHTYAKQGYFPTRITLSDASGPLGQATGEAVVADTKFTLFNANISAFAGVPFSGTVATLNDLPSGDVASDFDVKIDWADGTTSAGTLQSTAAGKFAVRGSHTWTTTGVKNVVVTVTEHGSASGQGRTLAIGSNTNFSGTVAQLQLPIPGSAAGDYSAMIDWGDKTTSPGTLTLQADGSLILSGSHKYATGNKSFVTHFTVTGGPSAKTSSNGVVNSAVGTVTGTFFNDINGNGKQDTGEGGIHDQTVFIDLNNNGKLDSGEPSAITNSSGVYIIRNIPAGSIHVRENVPDGLRVDAPASGSYSVTLNAGQTLANLNFANTQLALISGTVFVDANGNGKQDASETGRANQIIYLDLNKDGVLQPTEPVAITDATGAFVFAVNAGSYVVRLEPFSDFTITTPTSGAFNVTVGAGATNSNSLFGEKLIVPPSPPSPPPVSPPHSPPPSPKPPPTLHTPPLLALFDSILGGIEKVVGNGTETVTDSIFGFPLLVSTYDSAGNLVSVTLFGIDVTSLFELL